MNRFVTLLKREYWENRGGFLWAPVWTTAIMLILVLIGLSLAMWHGSGRFNGDVHIGVPLKQLVAEMPPDGMAKLALGFEAGLAGFWVLLQAVLFFVVAFYLLGALYDDRRDRSVLFWKSLPISDLETVASKVVVAVIGAPLIAFAATVVMHLGFLVLLSGFVLLSGLSPMQLVWGPAEPLALWLKMLAAIPVNALWALPTVGWLLLVSAFARSKPFLWAVALPVAVGVALNIMDVFETLQIPNHTYWTQVAGRILLSIAPMSWALSGGVEQIVSRDGDAGPAAILYWHSMASVLGSAQLWIGAAVGMAMLAGAVYWRRNRELAD
jgi:ABC-2 type transport system permease protein